MGDRKEVSDLSADAESAFKKLEDLWYICSLSYAISTFIYLQPRKQIRPLADGLIKVCIILSIELKNSISKLFRYEIS